MGTKQELVIEGGDMITPFEILRNGRMLIKGGKIAAIGAKQKVGMPRGARRIAARGDCVIDGG